MNKFRPIWVRLRSTWTPASDTKKKDPTLPTQVQNGKVVHQTKPEDKKPSTSPTFIKPKRIC